MKVLQLIDSLHPGGAERVAVNIANALVPKVDVSYLCVTREEGLLKESIRPEVHYLFLNKKKTIDFKAIKKLSVFVKLNNITIIHAHSTSFFIATIIKILNRNVKIVWHDHYGDSEFLEKRPYKMLKASSNYFYKIYSVNQELEAWAIKNLYCKNVSYLPNFAVVNENKSKTILKGMHNKRIIHLANLRVQKDHFTLLKAFAEVIKQFPEWSLHCVGKDNKDHYSYAIKQELKALNLENIVFIYGSKSDVSNILSQSDIGVLSSESEGLPIALLEYGLAGLPTVSTHVGNCNLVIANQNLGQLIEPKNPSALSQALINYISDKDIAKAHGMNLKVHILAHFSAEAVTNILIEDYKLILS